MRFAILIEEPNLGSWGIMHHIRLLFLSFILVLPVLAAHPFYAGRFCIELEELCPTLIQSGSSTGLPTDLQEWLQNHEATASAHFPSAFTEAAWTVQRLGSFLLIQCDSSLNIP